MSEKTQMERKTPTKQKTTVTNNWSFIERSNNRNKEIEQVILLLD